MRVLQLIDSLRPGGAEQIAVSYANALVGRAEGSYLCCTRMEGILRSKISPEVGYLFLKKRITLDIKAFSELKKFIQDHKIDLIQAHSSSFFFALLLKISHPKLRVVWHDHLGDRAKSKKHYPYLRGASYFFDGIISVNQELAQWSRTHLKSPKVKFIKNFITKPISKDPDTKLKKINTYKIICVANLRPEKGHLILLRAFKELQKENKQMSLHLIGKKNKDSTEENINSFISENRMSASVFLYGEQKGVQSLLKQADLAVLPSLSEGLPVALLEYGQAGLPVVCSNVGECKEVLGRSGKLVPPENYMALSEALLFYINNPEQGRLDGVALRKKILSEFSEEAVIPEALHFFKSLF